MNGPEAGTLIIRLSLIAAAAILLTTATAPARWLGAAIATGIAISAAVPLLRRAFAHACAAADARDGERWLRLAAHASSEPERRYCQAMARAAFDRHTAHTTGART